MGMVASEYSLDGPGLTGTHAGNIEGETPSPGLLPLANINKAGY